MRTLLAATVGALVCGAAPVASACDSTKPMQIEAAWSRATARTAPTAAIYLRLSSCDTAADRLIGARSPLAERVEFHESQIENGVSRMSRVGEVDVHGGATVNFAPGGLHIMLIGLKNPLKAGDEIPFSLEFARNGSIEAVSAVVGFRDRGPAATEHKH